MTDVSVAAPQPPLANRSRRTFLAFGALGACSLMLAASPRASAWSKANVSINATPEGFLPISRLLTGHAIDHSLAERGWSAITSREQDFPARFAALENAVGREGLVDMQHWSQTSIAADPALKATALAIVSAWYLGVVGDVKDRAEDGPSFITYEGALMWRPTLDVTVIPTYSRGRPGFWKEKPASTPTD